ncbi:hypothetical protein RINTHM_5620 [Richelia intracellularis HM01]|nr:hypothetical protein RINTHM_5620 [Richelia intracellularis HM01]
MLSLISFIPPLQNLSEEISYEVLHFLAVFGSGISSFRGLCVISLTCSFVGGLFDTYAYYRCHILRINP